MNVPAQQHDRLTEKLNAFYQAFQSISQGVLIVRADLSVIFANDFMSENFGFSSPIPGLTFGQFFNSPPTPDAAFPGSHIKNCENRLLRNSLYKIFRDNAAIERVTFSYSGFTEDKHPPKWFQINGAPLFFDNEVLALLTFVDITPYKQKEKQLLKRLELDLSTNTLNKHTLLKNINEFISAREIGDFTLCMIDFDRFKAINDNHGHVMGDKVLKTFSRISRKNIRAHDMIGRYGGEEFIFVFPDTDLDDAVKIIIRIQKEVKRYFSGLLPYPVSFSAGMLHVEACQALTCTGLINQVDKLLYQAKERGKDRIVTLDKEYKFL